MRIISGFHDYYDIGMQNGVDPQLPYRRFRREELVEFSDANNFRHWGAAWRRYSDSQSARLTKYCMYYIGFAGKVWSCMDITNYNWDDAIKPSVYVFDPDLIDDSFFVEIIEKDYRQRYRLDTKRDQDLMRRVREKITCLFEHKNEPTILELFDRFKTAIFVYQLGSETIVINERLSLYNFQKVLPPMQAFQELAMYVGAYLTKPVIEEPPISDRIKAEIHGFDKFSFRKGKRKSRRNRARAGRR